MCVLIGKLGMQRSDFLDSSGKYASSRAPCLDFELSAYPLDNSDELPFTDGEADSPARLINARWVLLYISNTY